MNRLVSRLAALALLGLVTSDGAQAQGIQMFEGTWSQVLAEAKRTGKPIYLDAYASWCGPCKMLKRDVFPDAAIGAVYNASFINVSMDMEKGEGVELARKFGVSAYPTHLFFDPSGNLVHRAVGANEMPAFRDEFIQWANNARDPKTQIYTQLKRFNSGERDTQFLHDLALAADAAYMPEAKAVARAYFDTQNDEALLAERNWKALSNLVTDVRSREFKFMLANREKLGKVHGQAIVDARILGVANAALGEARTMTQVARKAGGALGGGFESLKTQGEIAMLGQSYLTYYELTEQWDAYAKTAVRYVEEGKLERPGILNELAWNFYEHVDDRALLAKAVDWAERALKAEDSYSIADTYAAVLYKVGRKKEALKAAEHAIELAKKDGTDYAETESLLGRIRTEM